MPTCKAINARRERAGGQARRLACRAAAAIALMLTPSLAVSAEPHVYDGITARELVAFAEREGWSGDARLGWSVELTVEGTRVFIELSDCDDTGRCRTGIIRTASYHFDRSRFGFWHWNLETHGATGYGPGYVTLQRYLHFAGVTDQYLREVIGEIWPRASRDFWTEVEERYASEQAPEADEQ